jgi:hypothetical protein
MMKGRSLTKQDKEIRKLELEVARLRGKIEVLEQELSKPPQRHPWPYPYPSVPYYPWRPWGPVEPVWIRTAEHTGPSLTVAAQGRSDLVLNGGETYEA